MARIRYKYQVTVTRIIDAPPNVATVAEHPIFDLTVKSPPDLTQLTALLTHKGEE